MVRRILVFVVLPYALLCVVAGVLLANISVHLPKRPLPDATAIHERLSHDFHAQMENVAVTAPDGAVLRAWFIQPPSSIGASVMILHGIASNRIDYSGFADMFLRRGYSVLLPDSREHGASGGSIATYGVLERNDIHLWAQFLRDRAPHCTFLLGESMGAAIGLQATAVTPQLCAVAVESPYATFREVSYERLGRATGTGAWSWRTFGRPIIEVAIFYTRFRYGIYLPDAEPKQAVEHSSVPTLLIAGTKDRDIPMHHAQELEKACSTHCSLWIVPGAEHGGASTVAKAEFEQRVLTWFQEHSDVPAGP